MRHRIRIDFADLEAAFEGTSLEATWYLDLETGGVVMVTDEMRHELEDIYQEAYNDAGEEVRPFADILEMISNDYLVLGTVDRPVWKWGERGEWSSSSPHGAFHERMHRWWRR